MKKIIFSIILILVLAFPAFAANHYILAGATGTATGADWTNAWTSFPATSALVRGDTYYVGVGTYTFDGAPYNISNAVSGDLYITFQKATIADHGTGTGWDSSYAGQAILTRTTMAAANQIEVIEITTSYITINGAVGSGPDTTSYGFKITPPTVGLTSYSQGGIILYQGSSNISNISVQHIAFIGAGNTSPGSGSQTCNGGIGSGYNQPGSISNIDFEYNYFYNFTDSISLIKTYTGTIAHNYFAENWSDSAYCHGQQLAADATSDISVFDNTFNAAEYAVLGAHSNVGSNLRWNIYNNIILNNWVSMYAGDINNGVFNGWVDGGIGTNYVGNTLQNFKIYQNTYVGVAVGTWGLFNPGPLSDPSNMQSQFYNNLIYNSSNPRILCDSTHYVCVAGAGCSYSTTIGSCSPTSGLHDYNAYLKCTGTYNSADESYPVINNENPFVNLSSENLRLAAGASPNYRGVNLSQYFTTDMDGNPRGKSRWSIGAYRAGGHAPPKDIDIKINQ